MGFLLFYELVFQMIYDFPFILLKFLLHSVTETVNRL